ncbi:MAG: AMIN domain-containing protein, partial [Desulfobulbaceae bacterium]|nr:AMIN domain-containing protein [Desulfobulbaceae bacterium]
MNFLKNILFPGTRRHLCRSPVQYWSSDDYTRIVIRSSGPVRYKSLLTEKKQNQPRRLFVDFAQSSIEPQYTSPVHVEDGLLKKIHTRQSNPTTVRVALEIESISTYKIFSLNDPFRVIVDVHGQQKIISASKTLPQVGQEKIAGRPRPASNTPPVLTPAATKSSKQQKAERSQYDHSETFIVLEDHNKKEPGSAAKSQAVAGKAGLTL